MEKKLSNSGVVTVEAEYAKYDGLGGYPSPRRNNLGASIAYDSSDGYYALGAYLFPQQVGIGKFQVLGKYGQTTYDFATGIDVDQKTLDLEVNYIIKTFNARVSLFYIDVDYSPSPVTVSPAVTQIGLGLQVQI
jgi:hypothetical protein